MGGGFVHQKKIGWIEEDFDQGETRFFSSAEDADGFKDIVTTEKKGTEDGTSGLFAYGIGRIEDGFEYLVFHIESVAAVLRKVTDAYVMSGGSLSALDGNGSAEEFEEGGFSCTVGTDENGALTAFGFKIEASVDDEITLAFDIAVGVIDIFQGDGAESATKGLREGELDRTGGGNGSFDFFHAIDLLEFALGLGGFAGLGPEAVGKLLEGGDFFSLIFVSSEVLLFAGRFFDDVLVVVAAVAVQFGLRNFDNGADQLIEKFAVVGDHENGSGVISQIFLKPDEGFEVEMVGGFVEKKKIGFLDKEAGEVGSHNPAPTEGACFTIEVGVAKGKTAENLFGAGFELPSSQFGEGIDGFVIFRIF